MSRPTDREREVPEGSQRRQVVTTKTVRDYIKRRKKEAGRTYSEQLNEWLPSPDDAPQYGYAADEVVNLKVVPALYDRIDAMAAGKRVTNGEVVALYALRDALQRDDYETAAEIIAEIPDLLIQIESLADRSDNLDDTQQ